MKLSDSVRLRLPDLESGRTLRWILLAAASFWLMKLPGQLPEPGLESSWRAVLNYAAAHRSQYGIDIFFTYGPLGYLSQDQYDPATWLKVLFFQVLSRPLYLALVWRVAHLPMASATATSTGKWVFVAVAAIMPAIDYDSFYLLFITFTGIVLCQHSGKRLFELILICFLGPVSLIKFTYLVLTIVTLGCVILWCLLNRRKAAGIWIPSLFAVAFAFAWRVLGQQQLAHLPRWVHGSMEIARGYTRVMGLPAPVDQCAFAVLALLILMGYLAISLRSLRQMPLAMILLAGLGLAWKQGFTRGDLLLHIPTFSAYVFTIFASIPFLTGGFPLRDGWLTFMLGLSLGTLLLGRELSLPTRIVQNLGFLLKVPRINRLYAQVAQVYDLPAIRAILGSSTVDMVGYDQSILILNGFNYHPLPVFHAYSAGTPYLARLNADFYQSEQAPDYILWRPATIGTRLKNLDESISGLVIAQRYHPVAAEKGYTLLRRVARGGEPLETLAEGTISAGERFEATSGEYVEIHMQENVLLRVLRTLWTTPRVYLITWQPDGETSINQFIPSLGAFGFVVPPNTVGLAVQRTRNATLFFAPAITYRVSRIPVPAR
jgi:hypothetical protein